MKKALLALLAIAVCIGLSLHFQLVTAAQLADWGVVAVDGAIDGLTFLRQTLTQYASGQRGDDILLVNAAHPLPADYEPAALVRLYEQPRSFQLARDDLYLAPEVFEAAERMFAAAAQEGITGYILTSAYRTRAAQEEIYRSSEAGLAQAPGCSEHETGLAFDVTTMREGGSFEDTPHYKWLQLHCHEYGFIQRYPEGKQAITGVVNEPWHYRYVGEGAARAMRDAGLTLEEYLGG